MKYNRSAKKISEQIPKLNILPQFISSPFQIGLNVGGNSFSADAKRFLDLV